MGKSLVIIGNGQFPITEYPVYKIRSADYIICCDGALGTFMRKRAGLGKALPDVIIGDMDSLVPDVLAGIMDSVPDDERRTLEERLVHIEEQEDNDQTKAFVYAIENFKDIDAIHIVGATGLREDHTIGNMSLLMEYTKMYDLDSLGITVDMISDYSTVFPITDSISLTIGKGRNISIFSPDNSLRIKSQGLVWPVDNVVFDNWWKASLNRASENEIKLTFNHPSIALIVLE
jgi:thiamine pyrophosphokinase